MKKARKFIYYSYNGKSYTGGEYAKGNVAPYGTKWEVRENSNGQVRPTAFSLLHRQ